MDAYEKRYIHSNDVLLHVVLAGPEDGEPVMLLHGFPEFWYGWHNQIDFLAAQGYRVIVPDQRGYNLSDKPEAISEYYFEKLVGDVVGLMDALEYEQVNLVGHDWGAVVAWFTAIWHPERLKRLTIMNVPHPSVALDQFRNLNLSQISKSWYIFFFQLPFVPEMLVSLTSYESMTQLLKQSGKPGTFSAEDLEMYRQAWKQPGAMTAMLNWYRAMGRQAATGDAIGGSDRVKVPTLMLWGEQDVALDKVQARPSIEKCNDGLLITFPDATHWVQHDEADEVNRLLGIFLAGTLEDVDAASDATPAAV